MIIGIFNGTPGQNSYAISEGGLPLYGIVQINGNIELESIIQFNDGGCVYGITLSEYSGPTYDYVITVDGQGPKGSFSGSGYLVFTDATGDSYDLSIYKSDRAEHTVRFNSSNPVIKKIEWHN